jgi:hypothetical protein
LGAGMIVARAGILLALVLLASACGREEVAPAPKPPCYAKDTVSTAELCMRLPGVCGAAQGAPPSIGPAVTVVPDAKAMPPQIVSQQSHNNLDIAWHDGRLFFAFRTAPSHFASSAAVMYVVSTPDQQHWTFETQFAMETDLREPRFLAIGGRLFLYFAVLGENPGRFEPKAMMMSEFQGGCVWSDPKALSPTGDADFIPWRTHVVDGKAYLIGYAGGANIYNGSKDGIRVHWLATEDGEHFHAAAGGTDSKVLEGGSSETDWAFLDDGSLVAVSRNEEGDSTGFGMKICRAPKNALGKWTCKTDPKKYDSPLVFRHGKTVYLIGRRNVTATGNFDLMHTDKSLDQQRLDNQLDYWQRPKRCALWTVDPAEQKVSFVLDLPSAGDTCFASVLPVSASEYVVYDYTSPPEFPDRPWAEGQQKPTLIHRLTLKLP